MAHEAFHPKPFGPDPSPSSGGTKAVGPTSPGGDRDASGTGSASRPTASRHTLTLLPVEPPGLSIVSIDPPPPPLAAPDGSTAPVTIQIGRKVEGPLAIPDKFRTVSRLHAELMHDGQQWLVRDLGSRSGTDVRGMRLKEKQWYPLADKDELGLGEVRFRVKLPHALPRGPVEGVTLAPIEGDEAITVLPQVGTEAISKQRLRLLIELSARVTVAETEAAVAEALLVTAMQASGYSRAALLSPPAAATPDVVLPIALRSRPDRTDEPRFSRSLINKAAQGRSVQLDRQVGTISWTTGSAGVECAICIPLRVPAGRTPIVPGHTLIPVAVSAVPEVDVEQTPSGNFSARRTAEEPIKLLYLDSREPIAGEQGGQEALAFLQAVAQIAEMALGQHARRRLVEEGRRTIALMSAARAIQEASLPPASGAVGPLRFAFHLEPARDVAGDLLDIHPLDGNRTAIVMGDVVGKGLPAAMLGAMVQSFVIGAIQGTDAKQALGHAFDALEIFLQRRTTPARFITLFGAIIDAAAQKLFVIDAGHGYWVQANSTGVHSPGADAPPMAIASGPFVAREFDFGPGDALILFSDGVCEQVGGGGTAAPITTDQFGTDPVVAKVTQVQHASGDADLWCALPASILEQLHHHYPKHAQEGFDDDVTICVVHWPSEASPRSREVRSTVNVE